MRWEDETLRNNLARYLGACGHDVDTAATGGEAMSLSERNSYDVMVTDLRLPDMDGLRLVEHAEPWPPTRWR